MSVSKSKAIPIIIILAISLIVFGYFHNINNLNDFQEQKKYEQRINEITSLYQNLGISNMNPNEPTLVIYFNSECDLCMREVKGFGENLHEFSGIKLAFVSSEPSDQVISFLSKYGLSKFHIETGAENIVNTFIGGVPQVFLYFDGKLHQHFIGETSVNVIFDSFKR